MNEKAVSVFEQYDLGKEDLFKLRGNYGCVTPNGKYILQEYDYSEEKLVTISTLQKFLGGHEILTEELVPNREGRFISVGEDGFGYYLKKFYDLEECNIKNEQHIVSATGVLAQFHKHCTLAGGIPAEAQGFHQGKNMLEAFEKHNKEIVNIRNYIQKRKNKNIFEQYLQGMIVEYYGQAVEAFERLKQSEYRQCYRQACSEKQLCIGNFNQHSIGFYKKTPVLLNLTKVHYAPKIHDLYDYLRKVLEKNDWEIQVGQNVLREYREKNVLEEKEIAILKILLSYPEKFWKIINYYYNSNKAWYSDKNEEKLRAFQNQEKLRWKYIETL